MRRFALLLLLSSASFAEPDAATAHPLRWCDPNGTPAGTRRSRCLPITGEVVEAWKLRLPGPAASPIVYWEREAYLACHKRDRFELVAIDVVKGEIVARKELPGDLRPMPVVWDGRVYVRQERTGIAEYRRAGRTLNRVFVHEPATRFVSDPIVFDNEIYCVADGHLVRMTPRVREPVWRSKFDHFRGRPALYGRHVYALCEISVPGYMPSMHLAVMERRDGAPVAGANAAWYAGKQPPDPDVSGVITVTKGEVLVRGPAPLATQNGAATHVMLKRKEKKDGLLLDGEGARLMSMPVPPSMTPLGVLALASSGKMGWVVRDGDGGYYLSDVDDNPDLYDVKLRVPATVLGDIVYFGAWAADIRTRRVLWRLPVRHLEYPAVPLDDRVLVVDARVMLRAFRGRGANE